jgi:hydroxyacylglutathione hydrolase
VKITNHIRLVGSGQIGLSNPMDCHVYLIGGPDTWMLVDAGVGVETERIVGNIAAEGVSAGQIAGILLSHAHSDHAGGAKALREAFGCAVYASAAEAALVEGGDEVALGLDRAKRDGVYPADYQFAHCRVDGILEDGSAFNLGAAAVTALVCPCHSLGSTAFLLEREGGSDLFAGDILFFGGSIGLLNCEGSDLAAYRANFPRLASLDIDGFFPGHFTFCVSGGKQHLDDALKGVEGLYVPKTF